MNNSEIGMYAVGAMQPVRCVSMSAGLYVDGVSSRCTVSMCMTMKS